MRPSPASVPSLIRSDKEMARPFFPLYSATTTPALPLYGSREMVEWLRGGRRSESYSRNVHQRSAIAPWITRLRQQVHVNLGSGRCRIAFQLHGRSAVQAAIDHRVFDPLPKLRVVAQARTNLRTKVAGIRVAKPGEIPLFRPWPCISVSWSCPNSQAC